VFAFAALACAMAVAVRADAVSLQLAATKTTPLASVDGYKGEDNAFCWSAVGGETKVFNGDVAACVAECKKSTGCVGFTIIGKKSVTGGNVCFLRTKGLEKPQPWTIDCYTPSSTTTYSSGTSSTAKDAGFTEHKGGECWPKEKDSVRNFHSVSGTPDATVEQCKAKCTTLGKDCSGFIRTPGRYGQGHVCYFRNAAGIQPVEPATVRCYYPEGTKFVAAPSPPAATTDGDYDRWAYSAICAGVLGIMALVMQFIPQYGPGYSQCRKMDSGDSEGMQLSASGVASGSPMDAGAKAYQNLK